MLIVVCRLSGEKYIRARFAFCFNLLEATSDSLQQCLGIDVTPSYFSSRKKSGRRNSKGRRSLLGRHNESEEQAKRSSTQSDDSSSGSEVWSEGSCTSATSTGTGGDGNTLARKLEKDSCITGFLLKLTNDAAEILKLATLEGSLNSLHNLDFSSKTDIVEEIGNVEKWKERYFFLKAGGTGLTLAHLSEKEDMAPVMKLLQPWNPTTEFVMKLPPVSLKFSDKSKAKLLKDMQHYEICCGRHQEPKTLPEKVYLFVMKASRFDTEERRFDPQLRGTGGGAVCFEDMVRGHDKYRHGVPPGFNSYEDYWKSLEVDANSIDNDKQKYVVLGAFSEEERERWVTMVDACVNIRKSFASCIGPPVQVGGSSSSKG